VKVSSQVTGIVLAAGPSRRFHGDRPKQLVEFGGEPLVRRVIRQALASRLRQILVVVGYRSETLAAVLAGLAVELVENPRYEKGQSSSVRTSLGRVEPEAEAALFIPCDQPFLTAELLDRLIIRFEETGGPIVAPAHEGQRGSPVLIARSLFSELESIQGDAGGRQIFYRHPDEIEEVPVEDLLPLRDIDTVDDYEELLRRLYP
jgi:molybdenum cofactor cytidylyltransferase